MVTRALSRLLVAALMALLLVACSANDGANSGDGSPPTNSTPTSTAGPTDGTVCTALSNVRTSASTLASDLQSRDLAAVRGHVSELDTAVNDLVDGMSSGAQEGADELRSAWGNVKSTFEGLDKSDIGQVRTKMQVPVDQLRTTLDSVTSGQGCS